MPIGASSFTVATVQAACRQADLQSRSGLKNLFLDEMILAVREISS